MELMVFATFARTISNLPAKAILKALDLESKMLEFAAENYRVYLPEDAYSIFCFRQFVQAAKLGKTTTRCMPLPQDHLKFYQETVTRLIEANELPQSAREQFDNVFSISHQHFNRK